MRSYIEEEREMGPWEKMRELDGISNEKWCVCMKIIEVSEGVLKIPLEVANSLLLHSAHKS